MLYILTKKAIPYFVARHRRQAFGFEGVDLEVRRWQEVLQRAQEISKSDIEELSDGDYRVQSHKNPNHWYEIDLNAGACNCESYPLISFCKHLAAIQNHFPDTNQSFQLPTAPPGRETMKISHTTELMDTLPEETVVSAHLSRIGRKILDIVSQGQEQQIRHLVPGLLDLETGLDSAKGPLLKTVAVAPNQHTWPETAAVMHARPKTKNKRNADPYGGGERSGKKAKPDTRGKGPTVGL